mmetsp:Transcript_25155/g.25355  ORF Transcript_25155/g.25355 Transcript_25155/m.25355 type:complete len:152 (-) Transcript_25155:184-639(-)|eukprot:CAMPEP_0182425378 /NCGR_PEP_ID=MMETSP1167-20130531/11802_1 /TAXON_ID=2988 /ORGANISM="Mallomonas Sp, Strain CCMP3275" /LENGTH=151 /DNA_ID=CAMNT_0024606055 /DNA_START=85 /DNA_END=540 /DNA_ORIENTATION=+
MIKAVIVFAIVAVASAFMPISSVRSARMEVSMKSDFQKVIASSVIGASLFFGGSAARAEIDYEGLPFLGGSEKIDLNNANVRVYLKLPGMYPNIAGKIVKSGPFKTPADVYNIKGLSGAEKEVLKKYESRFITLDEKPEYAIDKFNNGLYR